MLLLEDKTSKIINEIESYGMNDFYPDEDDDYCYAVESLYDFLSEQKDNGSISTGATKMVYIPSDVNASFVLKIPFYGHRCWHGEYDDEGNYIEDSDSCEMEDFSGAENSKNNYDYCRTELEVYEEAVAAGFADFFPYTALYAYGTDYTPNVYIQEKAKSFSSCYDEGSEEVSSTASKLSSESEKYLPFNFICSCILYYGAERTKAFLDWVDSMEVISDIHNGNIGRRQNGAPIIIDFAGFRW